MIHAGSPIATSPGPEDTFAEVVDGTRAIIANVLEPNPNAPILFTSSGAVYGRQPPELTHIDESFSGGPDQLKPAMAYHEAKRAAELLLASATARGIGKLRLARLFAFIGPGLPLDGKYAAGNFVRDAIAKEPIRIGGDGTPHRSYLYPTDMIAWSLAVLARGTDSRAYNVGSDESISIGAFAARIGAIAGTDVVVAMPPPDPPRLPERYVPDTTRIISELGVRISIGLDEAITRTLAHYGATL